MSVRGKPEAEIAPFRLTGVDGYVQLRYLTDATSYTIQPGDPAAHGRQSILMEEIFVLTHSYVYHPSLLSLDIGGGPVFERARDQAETLSMSGRRHRYNLTAQATVLRDKPYTAVLSYDRDNRTQSMGPALAIVTENTRYGLNLSLRNPVTPVPARLELTRTTNHGASPEQLIDDRVDQLRLTLDGEFGTRGSSTFQYLAVRQDSSSGSSLLPIQATSLSADTASLDTRLKLGRAMQYELANMVLVDRKKYRLADGTVNRLDNSNFSLEARGHHSEDLQTNARYSFNGMKQDDDSTTLNSATAGLSYRFTPELSSSGSARAEFNRGTRLDSTVYGVDGALLYQRRLPIGQASLGYTAAYNRRDQQAMATQARIIGERVTLAGTSFVTLGKRQVDTASVVVSNVTRSQNFVQGLDYTLTPLGLNLRLQRLIGGNILDGQEVLIDYVYEVGGTYALSQLDQSVSLGWSYSSYLSLLARSLDSAPRLVSGVPTAPVNPARSLMFGLRSDVPLPGIAQGFLVGGNAERERRREAILPYRSATYETYVQADLPYLAAGILRLGARRMEVDYENSPAQAVKLRGYDLRLWALVGYGINASLDATRERDTGTPLVRRRSITSARAHWRYRKASLRFELTRTVDAQGLTDRSRTYGQLTLRRDL